MMPPQAELLLVLNRLQQEVHQATSQQHRQQLIEAFLQQTIAAAAVAFCHTAAPSHPTYHIQAIPGLNLWLEIQRDRPLQAEEQALVTLVAEIMGSAAAIQPHIVTSLLHKLNGALSGRRDLNTILSLIAAEWANTFPALSAQLLVVDAVEWQLHPRLTVGHVYPELLTTPTSVSEELIQTISHNQSNLRALNNSTSELLIPITLGETPEGIWRVLGPNVFLQDHSTNDTLHLIAGQLGIAISQDKYYRQKWQQSQRIETIYSITESARLLKPLRPTLAEIHQQLIRAFQAPTCYIGLYDVENQLVNFPLAYFDHQEIELVPISVFDRHSLMTWVIRNNEPYATEDWHKADRPVSGLMGEDTISRSVLCFPMQVKDAVVGVISIQHPEPRQFDESDYYLLAAIAGHLAVIIDNANLYTTTNELAEHSARQFRMAEALQKAAAIVSTSLELNVVLDHILSALSQVVEYDCGIVTLIKNNQPSFFVHRSSEDEALVTTHIRQIWEQTTLLQTILESREPIVINDVWQDSRWLNPPDKDNVRSWIGAPLVASDHVLGLLLLESHNPGAYGEQAIWLMTTLASHAAIAVHNADLYHKTQQQLDELATLYQASATISATLDQQTVLQTILKEMLRVLAVDGCSIFLWDENQKALNLASHENRFQNEAENRSFATGLGLLANLRELQLPAIQTIIEQQNIRQIVKEPGQNNEDQVLLERIGLQSLLLVPLTWRHRLLGLLGLGQLNEPRVFQPDEIRLAHNLASQAAVTLEHARLFTQAQQRIAELSAFQKIALQINSPLALREVLNTIGEAALRLVNATNLHIYLYEAERQTFGYGLALWRDGHQVPIAPPRPDGLTATVVKSGEPLVINNAQEHILFQSQENQLWEVQAIAGFPLKRGDQIIGAFTAAYLHDHTFTDDELILLNLLADQAAVAVHNANLFDNLQHQLEAMSALVDMAQQVTGKLELASVMQTTVETLQHLLEARASSISLLHGDDLVIEAATGIKPEFLKKRMRLGEGVSGRAVQERRAIYQQDTQADPDFLFFDKTVRSLLAVPLIHRDMVLGTLTVDSDLPNAFDEQDQQLLTVAAAQVSVAIANANFVREIQEHAEELSLAYEELKESDRLKDELVQNVSHELRTPLTFVKGYVDLLMDGEMGLLTDEQRSALQIVATKTSEITRLIEDIVTLQRIEEGNLVRTTFSLGELVRTAVAGHKLNLKPGINLHLVTHTPLPPGLIHADKGRVTQVLDNLMANAIKFSPEGGTIVVDVQETENEVLMVISDEGIGVPQDKLDRIFDRFYQVDGSSKRRFGGTGIGLALVKRIVEAHKGRVWVLSELKKGSSFYVALPKAA